jgi:hypothetical protein
VSTARLGQSQDYVSTNDAETSSSSAGLRKRETLSTYLVAALQTPFLHYSER